MRPIVTGTIRLRVSTINRALWPGAFVTVALSLPVDGKSIVVPTVAIGEVRTASSLRVNESIAEQRHSGRSREQRVDDRDGVQPGEMVVVDGQSRLSPNARIAIFPVDKPATGDPA
jgi:multidrug efflux system membrane fusion protein